ncbi:MAG: hypothetical protein JWL71_3227 [Acidobacteria bacterium]|nr:hypothetical protein [Acidobacteriota bacterium]
MLIFLPIHIVAAGVGLIAGAVALSVAKGGRLHRTSGMLFVYAILTMCVTAIVLATMKGQAVNVMVGLMTSYLAITAVTTVRPPVAGSRRRDIALMVTALVLGLATMGIGFAALANPKRMMFGYPAFPLFLFGVLGLSGAFGDFKTMRAGTLRGAPRLSRHVWRMSMALWITTISFFSIRARVAAILPAPLVTPLLRALPVLLVIVAMFYSLWRVRFRRSFTERWPGGGGNVPTAAARPSYGAP